MEAIGNLAVRHSQHNSLHSNKAEARREAGRYVRKGEHGVKVVTFIETKSKEVDQDTGEPKNIRRPWTTTVFHISQTEAMNGGVK